MKSKLYFPLEVIGVSSYKFWGHVFIIKCTGEWFDLLRLFRTSSDKKLEMTTMFNTQWWIAPSALAISIIHKY